RLPAVTAVPPGLCGVGLGGLRDGGGHVAEAGGPVGLPVPLGNVGPGGQVADALLHFGFPSLVSLVTTTLLVSRRPVNPARQISRSEKRTTLVPASALYSVAAM